MRKSPPRTGLFDLSLRRLPRLALVAAVWVASSLAMPAIAATLPGGLMAGVGKALIDPPPAQLPIRNNNDSPLVAVHDSLYARALVLQQGNSKVVIVVADAITLPDEFYEQAVAKLAVATAVARDHVLLSATHVHTVPWSFDNGYAAVVLEGIMSAAAQAQQHLEPVRVGVGEGRAYINMNRDEQLAGAFILGQDPEGPSDKAVRVAGFFRGDGSPLAILAITPCTPCRCTAPTRPALTQQWSVPIFRASRTDSSTSTTRRSMRSRSGPAARPATRIRS